MREHMGLYRGKRIDNGEWVEGFYHRVTDNWTHTNVHFIMCFQDVPLTGETFLTAQYGVDPNTVGECTGKTVKTGKVFEGDVGYSIDGLFYVRWDEEKAAFVMQFHGYPYETLYLEEMWDDAKIIGNIHDNPELLKGGEGDG